MHNKIRKNISIGFQELIHYWNRVLPVKLFCMTGTLLFKLHILSSSIMHPRNDARMPKMFFATLSLENVSASHVMENVSGPMVAFKCHEN